MSTLNPTPAPSATTAPGSPPETPPPATDSRSERQHAIRNTQHAILLLILGLSLTVRLVGLGWGIPAYTPALMPNTPYRSSYHLDEDNFLWGLLQMHPAQGDFDVRDYHWGTLQFYLIYGVLEAAQAGGLIPAPWETAFQQGDVAVLPRLYLLGRLVSLAAGLAATLAVIGLGTRLAGRAAGWAAGVAYALAPLAVVEAHYLTNDVTMSALVVGMVWAAVNAVQRGLVRWLMGAGLLLGLAVAAKYSAAFAAPALLVAQIAVARRARAGPTTNAATNTRMITARRTGRELLVLFGAPWLTAAGGFIVGEPYVLLKPGSVWQGLRDAAAANAVDAAAGVQGALGMLRWQATNLAVLGLTWPLAALALLGLGVLLFAVFVRSPRLSASVVEPAAAAVLLAAGAGLAAGLLLNRIFMLRYTQPLVPLLAVAAGAGWAAIPWAWARVGSGALAVLGAGIITWGQLALLVGPHPANELMAWLGNQLRPGQTIARAWPEYPPLDATRYTLIRMEPGQPALPPGTRPDYIVLDDMDFGPPAAALTQLLAQDYQEVARFGARPHLGPFAWDEGLTPHDWKYSHPTFVVYARR